MRALDAPCGTSDQCICGLDCVAGACSQPCTNPGAQDTCPTGRVCAALTNGDIICLQQAGLDELCDIAVCGDGLECQPTVFDFGLGEITESTCHTPCGPDDSCPGTSSCLPASAYGFFDVQGGPDAGVPCAPDAGGNTACDTARGFACNVLADGPLCSRPLQACGTAVGVTDLRPDAGLDLGDLCNLGATFDNMQGTVVAGSRFCDDFPALTNPPETTCLALGDTSLPQSLGYCIAICQPPNGTPSDCPATTYCSTTDSLFFSIVDIDEATPGVQHQSCVDATNCTAHPGSTCEGPFVSTNLEKACAMPYGLCVYGPS